MNTTLHITIDKKTKKAAAELAKEMGLDLSSVVKASLKNFVQTKTFHVEKSFKMTPYLERIISLAESDFQKGKNLSPSFDNAEEAMNWIEKQGK